MKKLQPPLLVAPDQIDPQLTFSNYQEIAHAGFPGHNVHNPELVLVVDGALQARDPDHEQTRVGPGDVVFLRPGRPCDLMRDSRVLVISCIHFDLLPGRYYAAGDYGMLPQEPWVVRTKGDWVLVDLFRRCAAVFAGYHVYRDSLLTTIFKEIWLRLMGHMQQDEVGPEGRMAAMTRFLRARMTYPVGREDLAREFNISPEHVNYLFKKQLGTTPTRFLNRERVLKAAHLLQEGRSSVQEVAEQVGFDEALDLSRVFKSVLGLPPSRMR